MIDLLFVAVGWLVVDVLLVVVFLFLCFSYFFFLYFKLNLLNHYGKY